jgi:hypothetical protein
VSGETIIEGGGLRVVFTRQGDRFSHTIGYVVIGNRESGIGYRELRGFAPGLPTDSRYPIPDSQFVPLLESVEGTPDDRWPPSPPLQSLHCEDRADGKRVALLVGMAGRSHWSLSLELDPVVGTVTWDVACRVHDEPGPLTSSYRVAQGAASMHASTLSLSSGARRFRLRVEAAGQLELSGASQIVMHCNSAPGPLPRTARWRYVLAVEH